MHPIPILAGPTGSRKTETAVALAEKLNAEIINADSLQVYKYFDIGTAKPTSQMLEKIPHHLINILEPDEEFSAFDFKTKALEKIKSTIERGKTPLLAGGTGLYLKVLTEDYDCGVQIDPEIKNRIQEEIKTRGAPALHRELQKIDPASADRIPATDPQRIERALSVYCQTNRKLSDYHLKDKQGSNGFSYTIFILDWERKTLYENINRRVDQMINNGLVKEVRSLLGKGWNPNLKPFQSIGYKQIIEFLNGQTSLESAIDKIKQETRRYAKRQITWFKKAPDSIYIPAALKDTPETLRDKIIPKLTNAIAIALMIALSAIPEGANAQKTQLQKAGLAITKEHFKKASELLNSKEVKQGKHSDFLSAVLDARENKKTAIEKLEKSLKSFAEIGDYIRYELSLLYSSRKENDKALKQIELLTTQFPKTALYPEVQRHRAKILESLGKRSEAIQVLEETLENLDTKTSSKKQQEFFPELTFQLAQIHLKEKNFEDADRTLKKIIIHFPNHAKARLAQTERKKLIGKKGFKSSPLSMKEKKLRLKALVKKVEYKRALEEINEISKANSPLPSEFYFFKARAHARMGQRAKSIKALQEYRKSYPGNKLIPEAMYKIARHQWNLGKNKKSNALFAEIIKKYPNNKWAAKAHYIIGRMFEDKKDFKQAGKEYLHLAENHSNSNDGQWAAWRLGWIHYQNQDYHQAKNRFGENARSNPEGLYIVSNLYWQAKSAQKLKDKNAKDLFRKVYDLYPYTYYGLRGLQESATTDTDSTINNDAIAGQPDVKNQRALKAIELTAIGLFPLAREELKLLEKNMKKNLSGVVWLSKLYNKAGAYSDSVRLLQLYRNHVGRNKEKNLPSEYWKTFYPSIYNDLIHNEAKKNKIDPNFIKGLIKQESLYEEQALSVAGARGLMQIMPATGRRINSKQKTKAALTNDDDLFDPQINIRLGAAYLKQLEASAGKNKAYKLIAYNAGPRVLKKWKKRFKHIRDRDEFTESIPYPETRNYVKKVLRNYWLYKILYKQPIKK